MYDNVFILLMKIRWSVIGNYECMVVRYSDDFNNPLMMFLYG